MMRQLGVIALASLLLAACSSTSSGSDDGNPPASDDPCSLLTIDQASAIIGEPAKPGHRNGTICMWDSTLGAGPYIKLDMISKALYDGANNTLARGVTKTSVDGIGDEAFAKDAGRAGHILWFRKGDKYFEVDAFAVHGPLEDLDAEKQIAQDILQKL